MEIINTLLKQFEIFIKRSIVPSSSFLLFFLLFDIFLNEKLFLSFLQEEHKIVMIAIIIILFVGVSLILTILHQAIYDNNIKNNYDGRYIITKENVLLVVLREKVIKTLPEGIYSDYRLYQIIGKKMRELGKPMDTRRYIDDIKSIGIVSISLLIVLFIASVKFVINDFSSVTPWITLVFASFVMVCIYILGEELIKSKYRSRAIRIYTNYLDEIEKTQ